MPFHPVVVAPTYNNAGTLPDILRRIEQQGFPIIVVNDGSSDRTADVLTCWAAGPHSAPVEVLAHEKNRGKAAAMRTGFDRARTLGYTHAVTIDTDGQLSPEQIPQLVELARDEPDAMVLGTRDDTAADYPARSRLGRRCSNMLIRMESGLKVSDSQCGLRVYPLASDAIWSTRAKRYGFETEVIVRTGWQGGRTVEAPVACTYFEGDRRVSHFQPWRDSIRAAAMHCRLTAKAMWPGHRMAAAAPPARQRQPIPFWRQVLTWLSPREAWRQIRQDVPTGAERTAMAGAIGIGAFIGCLPLYGLHAVIALYTARRLNLNPLAVILGTQIAFPPLGIAVAVAAVAAGHLLLHGSIPPPSAFEPVRNGLSGLLSFSRWFLIDWLVGSVAVGIVCLFLAFFLAEALLRRVPSKPVSLAQDAG